MSHAIMPAAGAWTFSAGRIRPTDGLGWIATLSEYDRAQQVLDGRLMAAAPDLRAAARDAAAMLEGIVARWHASSLTVADAMAMIQAEAQKLDHVVRSVRAT